MKLNTNESITYIVLDKICVVVFDTVIQDGHDDTLTRVSERPGTEDVHMRSTSSMLLIAKYTSLNSV